MRYADLSTKYSECKPIARLTDGRTVYALGELNGLDYGFIARSPVPVEIVPADVRLTPIDAFLKFMRTDWDYFQ